MNLKERLADPVFRRIGGIADAAGREVYVVGGYVRDISLTARRATWISLRSVQE